jgi:anti-anti-sigma factor
VLQVDGELDALTCTRFGQRGLALLGDRPDLIIDLSQVTFVDSSALKVLIGAHDAARGRVRLRCLRAAPPGRVLVKARPGDSQNVSAAGSV